jgi:hypothetical protein
LITTLVRLGEHTVDEWLECPVISENGTHALVQTWRRSTGDQLCKFWEMVVVPNCWHLASRMKPSHLFPQCFVIERTTLVLGRHDYHAAAHEVLQLLGRKLGQVWRQWRSQLTLQRLRCQTFLQEGDAGRPPGRLQVVV